MRDSLKLWRLVTAGATLVIVGSAVGAVPGDADLLPFHHGSNSSNGNREATRDVSISISGGAGSDATDLNFGDLLPGAPQTVTVNYHNTGTTAADIYVVFPNATALSALNSEGNLARVLLASRGNGAVGNFFNSSNLSDAMSCAKFSPSSCWPVISQYKIASRMASSTDGSFSMTFAYASAFSQQAPIGSVAMWNPYPVSGQTMVLASDGSGAGLPYSIVAMQPRVTPGQQDDLIEDSHRGGHINWNDSGRGFEDHIEVSGEHRVITYVVTSPDSHLLVTESGKVTTVGGPLSPNTYAISGTDSDVQGYIGTWTYSLVVANPTHSGGSSNSR